MARDYLIDIRARDGASPVFAKLGQSAAAAASQIDKGAEESARNLTDLQTVVARMAAAFEKHSEQSGQSLMELRRDVRDVTTTVTQGADEMGRAFVNSANRIETSLDKTSRATEAAERSMGDYSRSNTDMLSGLELLGSAFSIGAQQSRAHGVAVQALQRTYGEATASYVALSNTIQSNTLFSNDEALEATNIMGTLRRSYELTDEQIQRLIVTSADLAAVNGTTLADAAQRVAAAIRGEAESAEALGLTMNQAAIDQQGLTLSMTNAEAGAFRYNALLEQSAFATGAAGDAANTTAGKVTRLSNEFQDGAMSVVNFTGPVGEVVVGLSSFGLQAGLAASGVAQLTKGVKGLTGAGGVATLAASLAGPAGIAIAAGVAGYALWQLFSDVEDAGVVAFERATVATDNLSDSIDEMIARISDARIQLNLLGDSETFSGLTAQIERQLELFKEWGDPSFWQNGVPLNWQDTGNPADLAAAKAEWEELIALNARLGDSTQTMAEQVASSYNTIIQNSGPGSEAALQTAMNWVDAFQTGEITLVELNDRLNGVIADLPNYTRAALEAADATQQIAHAAIINATSIHDQTQAQIAANAEFRQWLELQGLAQQYDQEQAGSPAIGSEAQVGWLSKYAVAIGDVTRALMALTGPARDVAAEVVAMVAGTDDVTKSFYMLTPAVEQSTRAIEDYDEAFGFVSASLKEEIPQLVADFEAAMRAASGLGDALYDIRARNGTMSVDVAVNTSGAQNALASGFNAVVGGAQGMAQLAEQTAEWAGSLAHGITGQTDLDQLLLKGAISGKTYREALEANHRIQIANNEVQEDALRIQAKQLPVVAQLAEEHARYVDELADKSAAEQTVSLGYMDQAKAAQAMSVANLAAQAAMSGTTDSASIMIMEMAKADPILKAMLIDMGLLSETDGVLKVNFGDVESADAAINNLTGVLTTLTEVIAKAFNIDINLIDGASGPLANILATLNELDGKTSTVYINTIGGGLTLGASTGRTIVPRYVTGGTHGGSYAVVGEHGPELTWLPTGAQVTNAPASREPIERMGGSAGSVTNYYGPVSQTISQEASSFERTRAAIAGVRR
jgi:hypothetical protein